MLRTLASGAADADHDGRAGRGEDFICELDRGMKHLVEHVAAIQPVADRQADLVAHVDEIERRPVRNRQLAISVHVRVGVQDVAQQRRVAPHVRRAGTATVAARRCSTPGAGPPPTAAIALAQKPSAFLPTSPRVSGGTYGAHRHIMPSDTAGRPTRRRRRHTAPAVAVRERGRRMIEPPPPADGPVPSAVTVVVVAWRSAAWIDACLDAVAAAGPGRILVVDNASIGRHRRPAGGTGRLRRAPPRPQPRLRRRDRGRPRPGDHAVPRAGQRRRRAPTRVARRPPRPVRRTPTAMTWRRRRPSWSCPTARINNAGGGLLPDLYGYDRGLGDPDDGRWDTPEDVEAFCGAGRRAADLRRPGCRWLPGPLLPLLRGHRHVVAAPPGRMADPVRARGADHAPAFGLVRPAVRPVPLLQRAQPPADDPALRARRRRPSRADPVRAERRRLRPASARAASVPSSPNEAVGLRLRVLAAVLVRAPTRARSPPPLARSARAVTSASRRGRRRRASRPPCAPT